jgi:hypothetical protein
MTKTKTFNIFGVTYKTVQFPAVGSMEVMGRIGDMSPIDVLARTAAKANGQWVQLDTREAINEHVRDVINHLPPLTVLRGLTRVINDFSFAFARSWSGVKIPSRFKSDGAEPRTSNYTEPMIAQIIQEGMATLRELEEYYSLEDAFKMFDVIVAKSVNNSLAHEAAMKGKR